MSFEFYHFHSEQSRTIDIPAIGLQLVVSMPCTVSEGAVTVIETTNAPGFGPPLHRHDETEVFRVLEGNTCLKWMAVVSRRKREISSAFLEVRHTRL
jgi:hypothetical protein